MSRIETAGRLGVPTRTCDSCGTQVLESRAFILRKLWIDTEAGTSSRGYEAKFFACMRGCAVFMERLEAARYRCEPVQVLGHKVWIDDTHLADEDK